MSRAQALRSEMVKASFENTSISKYATLGDLCELVHKEQPLEADAGWFEPDLKIPKSLSTDGILQVGVLNFLSQVKLNELS